MNDIKIYIFAVNEATVNNFVGLFIIFLPRVVLFRVATLHIACVAGFLRGGKGKDECAKRGRVVEPSPSCAHFYLQPSLSMACHAGYSA